MTSAFFAWPAVIMRVGGGEGEDEAGADRLHVEGGAVGHAELLLHRHRGGREGVVGRRGRQDDQVDVGRRQAGIGERHAGGAGGEIGGQLAVGGDVALA